MNPRDTTSREQVKKFHAYDMLPQPLIGQSQIKRNTLVVRMRHLRHEKGIGAEVCGPQLFLGSLPGTYPSGCWPFLPSPL